MSSKNNSKSSPRKAKIDKKTAAKPKVPEVKEPVVEKQVEEIKIKDPRDWIRKIPVLKRGDEELHKKLSAERRGKSYKKHFEICEYELEGIFNYAFDTFDYHLHPDYNYSREKAHFTEIYRNGEYVPPVREIIEVEYECELYHLHSLELQNYLHISSDSIFSDLAVFFNIPYAKNSISDASPVMNKNLLGLQENAKKYTSPYSNPRMPFPFNLCVTGPQYSGKTTITSILSCALDVYVIHVIGANLEKKKSKNDPQDADTPLEEPYPLKDSKVIVYQDDKQIIAEISAAMAESGRKTGFLFTGYPTNKAQFSALDKAIAALDADSMPKSPRKKENKKVHISGLIVSMHTPETYLPRKVDPNTGHVFAEGFNGPSFMDLEGVSPIDFQDGLETVNERLIDDPVPDEFTHNTKLIGLFLGLENQLKKSTSVLVVGTMENYRQIIENLDNFLQNITTVRPCHQLLSPSYLLLPAHSYIALQTWQKCLEGPGQTIADQSKLVNSLSSKLDELTSNAIDRFSLEISQQDGRTNFAKEFGTKPPKEVYTDIWEESIRIRDENLSMVDESIVFAGLIDLVLEMKKAPKIVFMALASKLLYGMWFRTIFKQAINGNDLMLDPLNLLGGPVEPLDTPTYDFQAGKYTQIRRSTTANMSASNIPSLKNKVAGKVQASMTIFSDSMKNPQQRTKVDIEERRAMAELKGFDYLAEVMPSIELKESQNIKFDLPRFCQAMNIPMLKVQTSFNSTLQYAEEFFTKLMENILSDESLRDECATMLSCFRKFVISAKKKEAFMVNSIFDLRDSLERICYEKCIAEMERFSADFLNGIYKTDFEYAFDKISPRVETLARRLSQIPTPIMINKLVPYEYILKIAQECGKRKLFYTTQKRLLEIANQLIDDEDIKVLFEICTIVVETAVCIDVPQYLELYASTDSQADTILMALARN